MVKKLVKSLLTFCDLNEPPTGLPLSLTLTSLRENRAVNPWSNVAEDVSLSIHIANAIISSCLYIMTKTTVCAGMDDGVRNVIGGMMKEYMTALPAVWLSVAIDCARVSQSDLYLDSDEYNTSTNGGGSGQENTHNYEGYASPGLDDPYFGLDPYFTNGRADTNPLRGGLTYGSRVEVQLLKRKFDMAMPIVVGAFTASPSFKREVCVV
jgi:hypothetical protein